MITWTAIRNTEVVTHCPRRAGDETRAQQILQAYSKMCESAAEQASGFVWKCVHQAIHPSSFRENSSLIMLNLLFEKRERSYSLAIPLGPRRPHRLAARADTSFRLGEGADAARLGACLTTSTLDRTRSSPIGLRIRRGFMLLALHRQAEAARASLQGAEEDCGRKARVRHPWVQAARVSLWSALVGSGIGTYPPQIDQESIFST